MSEEQPLKYQELYCVLDANSPPQTKETAFVLDAGSFNRFLGRRSTSRTIEYYLNNPLPPFSRGGADLNKAMIEETNYLHDLARRIRGRRPYYVTQEVLRELHGYYRKLSRLEADIKTRGTAIDQDLLGEYITGVADAICSSQNYGVFLAREAIKMSNGLFQQYSGLVLESMKMELPEGDIFSDLESEEDDYDEFSPLREKKRHISETDAGVIALSIILANHQPTILFTTDSEHVELAMKRTCRDLMLGKSYLKSPPGHLRLYVGSWAGWKERYDSKNFVLADLKTEQ